MKYKIYRNKFYTIYVIGSYLFLGLISIFFLLFAYNSIIQKHSIPWAQQLFIILFVIYLIFCNVYFIIYHKRRDKRSYVILEKDQVVFPFISRISFKSTKKILYSEIDKIYTRIDNENCEEDKKSSLVYKIGSVDLVHGVAFHIKQEIYIIAVEDPLGLREELVKHMRANGVYM